ncbi:MAG: LegC family aminotransferase [Candidatus Pristimantibacillus lignocellulolyticus]|uniref:LegC family aminotransferase n=1 Tax=Candidatus Pristimantibacillus lignocellulolyticus TaxID=2994561 RepID=A0A9J6ZJC9_9BACL|nr:MAG: LegC family aminotransferase [Candidatus Pristimantibacillus lignocellulolyticus]
MNSQWTQLVSGIKEMYAKSFVPLHEPTFQGEELAYVSDCIKTGWVSSVGQYVNQFEEKLAEYTGVNYAISVVNGTAALQVALKVAGVQANDEVFMPSLTFIATANAASYLGAVPHFVDVSEVTLGLDPAKLEQYIEDVAKVKNGVLINKETGRVIRAVVPMHTFGHPVEVDKLIEVCNKYHLVLVEDAAESLGSYYKDQHTGSFGRVSAVSFNGNKIITTGGGGAILTNDVEIAKYAKHITTTAKVPHRWEYMHDEIGYNYRMPNLNAALGCAQLERISSFIEQKRLLTVMYDNLLSEIDEIRLFKEPINCSSNYWLQTLVLDESVNRDELLYYFNENGIQSRPIWQPLHLLTIYSQNPKSDLSTTNSLQKRVINIPSSPNLTVGEFIHGKI